MQENWYDWAVRTKDYLHNAALSPRQFDVENIVQEYLLEFDFRSIRVEGWKKAVGYTDVGENQLKKTKWVIDNNTVLEALQFLHNADCTDIYYSKNTLTFQIWQGISDICRGIAYCTDNCVLNIPFLTQSGSLKVEGWHWYVADYEQWRNREKKS